MFPDLKPATRFGSTPAHKNTFGSFCPSPASGMHLPEQVPNTFHFLNLPSFECKEEI